MIIGFDAKRLFKNFTGLGNYSRTLVQGLKEFYPENKYHLFTPSVSVNNETQYFINDNKFNIVTPHNGIKALWRSAGCTKEINDLNIDIYHGLSHELPIGIKKTSAKSIVTIHDLIYKTFPDDFKFIDIMIYDFKFKYACRNADKIIAISKSTKNDIIKYYKIPEEKIEVVYQSCHSNFKRSLSKEEIDSVIKKHDLPDEYILYVGSIIQRKNLLNIIKALNLLKGKINIPLVVVGKGNSYLTEVKKYINKAGLKDRIIFTSGIEFTDLPAVYQKALMFIYPSKYEGFGIPLIEALWSKTPVITSNSSSLPEAAGPGAFYCNPDNESSISDGILKILYDTGYAQKLVRSGFEHVQQFENEKTTARIMNIYKNIVES
jgi:glycosyltransferase involved in cell wall biosynthesis